MTATAYTGSFHTSFSGENYSLRTANGTLSLTGPAAASAATAPISVKGVTGGSGSFSVKLACPVGKSCASDTVTATIKVVKKVHRKRKTATKLVAKRVEAVASGKTKIVTIAIAKSLLRHGSVRVLVTITAGKKKLKAVTVTVKRPKRHRK